MYYNHEIAKLLFVYKVPIYKYFLNIKVVMFLV